MPANLACSADIHGFEERLHQLLKDHEKALQQLFNETCPKYSGSAGSTTKVAASHATQLSDTPTEENSVGSIEAQIEQPMQSPIHQIFADVDTVKDPNVVCKCDVLGAGPNTNTQLNSVTGNQSKREETDEIAPFASAFDVTTKRDIESDQMVSYVRQREHFLLRHLWKLDWLFDKRHFVEPPRHGALAEFVDSKRFDTTIFFVILVNCIYTIQYTNWQIQNLDEPTIKVAPLDACFACFFLIELTLKLLVHRWHFFCNNNMNWNIIDFTFVVMNAVEQVLSWAGTSGPDFIVVRAIRLLQAVKVMRAARIMYFLTQLRLMVSCLLGSFWALIWSFVVLAFVQLIFAVVLVQQIVTYLQEKRSGLKNADDVSAMISAFGSVQQAIFTLFMDISGGQDWIETYKIVSKTGFLARFIYVTYILIMWLSVTNIISSMFIEKALKIARPDMEEKMLDRCRDNIEAINELKKVFEAMDLDDSNTLTLDEFRSSMSDVRIRSYFELKGISIAQADTLFEMLSRQEENGRIDVDTFVAGCLRMKGYATNIDMVALGHQSQLSAKRLEKYIQEYRRDVSELHATMMELKRKFLHL